MWGRCGPCDWSTYLPRCTACTACTAYLRGLAVREAEERLFVPHGGGKACVRACMMHTAQWFRACMGLHACMHAGQGTAACACARLGGGPAHRSKAAGGPRTGPTGNVVVILPHATICYDHVCHPGRALIPSLSERYLLLVGGGACIALPLCVACILPYPTLAATHKYAPFPSRVPRPQRACSVGGGGSACPLLLYIGRYLHISHFSESVIPPASGLCVVNHHSHAVQCCCSPPVGAWHESVRAALALLAGGGPAPHRACVSSCAAE